MELKLAVRLLWKEKAFTLAAAGTLAVCMGANVALFTVVNSVLLRPLGVPDSDRVLLHYMPLAQDPLPSREKTFAIRTGGAPEALAAAVRSAVARIDPELPVYDVRTMSERLDRSLVTRRTPVLLSVGFGAVALLLSAVGLYGVLAYLVAHRRKEIGIRIALGSSASGVFRLVVREGALLVGSGLAVGAAGAVGLARVLASQLVGVRPQDPLVLASAITILAVVALVACALPAWRAARIDPVVALAE
jgi:predicted lysophospholipase L1 biosynthesis ABC-type transport system permease subunit